MFIVLLQVILKYCFLTKGKDTLFYVLKIMAVFTCFFGLYLKCYFGPYTGPPFRKNRKHYTNQEKTYAVMLIKCEQKGEKTKVNENGRKGEHGPVTGCKIGLFNLLEVEARREQVSIALTESKQTSSSGETSS